MLFNCPNFDGHREGITELLDERPTPEHTQNTLCEEVDVTQIENETQKKHIGGMGEKKDSLDEDGGGHNAGKGDGRKEKAERQQRWRDGEAQQADGRLEARVADEEETWEPWQQSRRDITPNGRAGRGRTEDDKEQIEKLTTI